MCGRHKIFVYVVILAFAIFYHLRSVAQNQDKGLSLDFSVILAEFNIAQRQVNMPLLYSYQRFDEHCMYCKYVIFELDY